MVEIIQAINTYGFAVAIIGILIYLIVLIVQSRIKVKEKKNENNLKIQREKQEAEKDKMILDKFTELTQIMQHGPVHTVEEERNDRAVNEYIMKQLDCLVEKGCSRAYFATFHNGGHDLLGRGFLKMSISVESVDSDIVPIMTRFQNIPRTMLPIMYKNIAEKDYYDVLNIEDIKTQDPMTYQFMIDHGASCALFRSVKKPDGLMIGFICSEYSILPEDIKKSKRNIDKKSNRIAGALFNTDGIFNKEE